MSLILQLAFGRALSALVIDTLPTYCCFVHNLLLRPHIVISEQVFMYYGILDTTNSSTQTLQAPQVCKGEILFQNPQGLL